MLIAPGGEAEIENFIRQREVVFDVIEFCLVFIIHHQHTSLSDAGFHPRLQIFFWYDQAFTDAY